MSSFTSGPERRLLFDNDDGETYDIRAERSPIIDRPLGEETREVHPEEPRITSTGMIVRPTPSIETSVSSSEPPRVPVTGILEYGEELFLLANLELVWVLVPLSRELLLEEVVEVMTLLVTIVIELMEDLLVDKEDLVEEDLQEEEEVNHLIMVIVMVMVMEKKVMKTVVFQVIEDHQALKDCRDLQVYKVFKDQEVYKVIEVYKDPLEDRVYKVYMVCLGFKDPEDLEVLEDI